MITSAAFSPIMKIALAMNRPGILGKTDASTTRRPSVLCTLKSLDSTPPRSLAHELFEILLAVDLVAGRLLLRDQPLFFQACRELAHEPNSLHDRLQIVAARIGPFLEVVEIDARRVARRADDEEVHANVPNVTC